MPFQEYHLAKRYYDMATEASAEALVPGNIALFKLNVVHYFSTFKEVFGVPSLSLYLSAQCFYP